MTEHADIHTLLEALDQLVDGIPVKNAAIQAQLDETGWTEQGVLIPLPTHILGQPLERDQGCVASSPFWRGLVPPFSFQTYFSVCMGADAIQLTVEVFAYGGTDPILVLNLGPYDNLVSEFKCAVTRNRMLLDYLHGALLDASQKQ